MSEIIAFCSQLSMEEERDWLNKISPLMNSLKLVPFHQLTQDQKESVKVAIVANPKPEELTELINLQWVQSLWSGVERLLTELSNNNVKIVRMVDPTLSSTMAEAVLAWTLYLHRDMPKYQSQQRNKQWEQHELIDINERRIGILGLGALGKASAKKLSENGFNVSGWSRTLSDLQGISCYHGKEGLSHILKETDILICLLPLTDETKGLLNKEILKKLPESASLINFSRGQIIIEDDLLYCLENNYLNHAVLDVFNTEPLPRNHPFWESPNITVLPHISAPTNKKSASRLVANNILNFFETSDIPSAVIRNNGY